MIHSARVRTSNEAMPFYLCKSTITKMSAWFPHKKTIPPQKKDKPKAVSTCPIQKSQDHYCKSSHCYSSLSDAKWN